MRAVQISKPGGGFEVVERPTPQPGRAAYEQMIRGRARFRVVLTMGA